MLKNFTLNRLLVLLVAAGFTFLLADSILEHWSVFRKEIMAYIPVLWGALGSVFALIAVMHWNEKWIRLLHLFLIATLVVGGAGLYFHIEDDDDEDDANASTTITGDTTNQETKAKEKEKPLLAPLTFAGLAVVGLLGTSRKWKAEVV